MAASRAVVFALISCSAIADQQECDPMRVSQGWNQCAVCHSVMEGDNSAFGPNLHGVLGRISGSLVGYAFSEAMVKSRLTWTQSAMDVFLSAPQSLVPGNAMPYGAVSDPAERAAIICKLANSNN